MRNLTLAALALLGACATAAPPAPPAPVADPHTLVAVLPGHVLVGPDFPNAESCIAEVPAFMNFLRSRGIREGQVGCIDSDALTEIQRKKGRPT